MINVARFGYIGYDTRVYVIVKKDQKYPMCSGKIQYLTMPTCFRHLQLPTVNNSLIAFLKEIHTRSVLEQHTTPPKGNLERVTCKDAMAIADMLSMPLAVVIDENIHGQVIFYKPKRAPK